MSELQQTVERLNELHAKTTQGEWGRATLEYDNWGMLRSNSDNMPIADFTTEAKFRPWRDRMSQIEKAWRTPEWEQGPPEVVANADFVAAVHNAWPAIAAELTRLREFEAAVREAMDGAKHDYERVGEVSIAIDELDRKRGEHASLQTDLQ